MVLMLIFGEALALYGLIVAIVIISILPAVIEILRTKWKTSKKTVSNE